METKICGECKVNKPIADFPLRKKTNKNTGAVYTWARLQCYECLRAIGRAKYKNNPENKKASAVKWYHQNQDKAHLRRKSWGQKNKEKISQDKKVKYAENKEAYLEKRKKYYRNNKEKVIESVNKYIKKNIGKVRARQRVLHHKKKEDDLEYVLMRRLRSRVRSAIKSKATKAYRTTLLVGCSIEFLIQHIESQFQEGMNWGNQNEWHIDHKIPCAAFDLTKEDQQLECFNWKNLQPLWAIDNLKKGAKY